jgi:hypothetical protein
LRSERRTIETALDQCLTLPPIVGIEERKTVYDWSENDIAQFTTLISLRRLHQRRQARTGVRTHLQVSTPVTPPTAENNTRSSVLDAKEDLTPAAEETRQSRRDLLRQFQAVIKAEEERGVATAVGRGLRWQPGRNPATTLSILAEPTLAGNSANAQEVAATEAKKVSPSLFMILKMRLRLISTNSTALGPNQKA